jgi:pilus assembly protein CpaD
MSILKHRHVPMEHSARIRRRPAIRILALAAVLVLAGCDRDTGLGKEQLLATLSDAEARNPISVVEQKPRLEIPLDSRHGDAGSVRLETARFLHQYKRTGGSKLHVSSPRGHGGHHGGHAAALHDVRHMIRAAGIGETAVVFGAHEAGDRAIRLSYARLAAVSEPCGDWSENSDLNRDNLPYKNFGCAVQSNMAVMIARPTDVLYPAPETPRGAERRTTDQKKHTEGTLGADTKSGISAR